MEGLGATLRLSVLAAPLFGAETLDGCVVARLSGARAVPAFRAHGLAQVLGQNGADGMQRFVAR